MKEKLETIAKLFTSCVSGLGYEVTKCVIDVCEDGPEVRHFIVAYVKVSDAKTLITIWEKCLEQIAKITGEENLKNISVIATRD